jgi:pyruvate kinase
VNWRITEGEEDSDDDGSASNITVRDINDISCAKKFEFDQITISGITGPEDVQEVAPSHQHLASINHRARVQGH